MSVNFKATINDLRSLVGTLKERCSTAELKIAEKDKEIEELKTQNSTLGNQLSALTSKYESLKAGTSMSSSPEEIAQLKDKYLALAREIDDCIQLMQHGR